MLVVFSTAQDRQPPLFGRRPKLLTWTSRSLSVAGAALFAREAQQHPMAAPGISYYLLTASGIVIALAVITATFPLLARITGPEGARNE